MRGVLRVLLGVALMIVPLALLAQSPSSGQAACDAHYPGQCVPSPPPDLNCPQWAFRDFPVLHPDNEPDRHGLESDRNGIGCEGAVGKPAVRGHDHDIGHPPSTAQAQALTATQGETLTLQFAPALPMATLTVGVWPGGASSPSLAVPAADPSRFVMTLAPGTHVLAVQVTSQGLADARVSYAFKGGRRCP